MEAQGDDRPGCRDNGLRAEHYVLLADVSPGSADSLLGDLAAAGIAAYVRERPHLAEVYVDARAERGARVLLPAEREAPLDEDAAWAAIVASLSEPAEPDVPRGPTPWPDPERVAAAPRVVRSVDDFVGSPVDLDAEEHFVPPPPPPAPRLAPVTVLALLLIAAGVLLLVVPPILSGAVDGSTSLLAVAAILGGFGTLVYRMKDGPPSDDDGAVV